MTEDIKDLIGDYLLSPESLEDLHSIMRVFRLKKYQLFLREGQVCDYWGYIHEGLLRIYYYKGEKEITEYFASEGSRFTSIESYFKRTPSHLIMETLEPTVIYAFHHDDFESLCQQNPEIEHYFRKTLELSLIISQHRLDSLQFETAQERYDKLIKSIPQIVLRVPAIYIASYLGITPETLSRVRTKNDKPKKRR